VSLLLAAEPDEAARAAYIEAVGNLTTMLAFTATPMALLEASLARLAATVEQAKPTNPAIRRHLHDALGGGVALLRQPRPWTGALPSPGISASSYLLFEPFLERPELVPFLSASAGDGAPLAPSFSGG